jgi:hypothetical protein
MKTSFNSIVTVPNHYYNTLSALYILSRLGAVAGEGVPRGDAVKIAGEHRSLEGKREIKGSKHASDELCCRGTFVFNNFCFDTTTLFFANNAKTSSFTRRRSGMSDQERVVVVAFLPRGRRAPSA